jgi:hypothetical protein
VDFLLALISLFFFPPRGVAPPPLPCPGEDEEGGGKLSKQDEELMADLTMEELKQAFRWVT